MFLLIITYGYVVIAGLMIYFIIRDRKNPDLFFGKYRIFSAAFLAILILGVILAAYSTLIEPAILITNNVKISSEKFPQNLKVAFVSDIQIGKFKKESWAKKIADKIEASNPDLVIFGGDQIDNEGTFIDESQYLEPLRPLAKKYPVYYVAGNHESGIGGSVRMMQQYYTGDRTQFLVDRFNSFGFKYLDNSLDCPVIKQQQICLFGIGDIWKKTPDYSELKNRPANAPLIYITHNPDGVLYFPANVPQSDLILTGHTHGGQIWLPLLGPMASAQTILGKEYYRGLKYWTDIPMYISVGAGESGAPLRLFAPPEVVILEIN